MQFNISLLLYGTQGFKIMQNEIDSMSSELLISKTYWNHFSRYAEEQGINQALFYQSADLDKTQQYVPLAMLKLLLKVMFDQGVPHWVGLEVADSILVSSHGHLGFGLSHARDLEQCLEFVTQYYQTRAQILDIHLEKHTTFVYLSVTPCGDWAPIEIVLYETIIKLLLNIIRFAVGDLAHECEIEFPYEEPAWVERYKKVLTTNLTFGAGAARIRIPIEWLSIKCVSGDANTLNMAKEQCEVELIRLNQHHSTKDKIAQIIESSKCYDLSIEAAASQLNVSKSTLIRKLRLEDTSFKQIIETLKKRYAIRLLTQTDQKIDVISIQLGYEDVSNFSRTFKRWFGCSPGAYREQHQN